MQVGPILVTIAGMGKCVPGSVDVTDDYPTRPPIRSANIIPFCQWRGRWTLDAIGNASEDLASLMQGRVMALHQTALFGSTPIGALLMGWVIHVSSPRLPFLLGGIAAFLCAAFVIARPLHRVAVATA